MQRLRSELSDTLTMLSRLINYHKYRQSWSGRWRWLRMWVTFDWIWKVKQTGIKWDHNKIRVGIFRWQSTMAVQMGFDWGDKKRIGRNGLGYLPSTRVCCGNWNIIAAVTVNRIWCCGNTSPERQPGRCLPAFNYLWWRRLLWLNVWELRCVCGRSHRHHHYSG